MDASEKQKIGPPTPTRHLALVVATRAAPRVAPNAKHVLHALLELDGKNGAVPGSAYATQRQLAKACGLSHVTAGRMIDELLELRCFKRVDRIYPRQVLPNGKRSEDGCTVFLFDYDAIAALAPSGLAVAQDTRDVVAHLEQRVCELEERLAAAMAVVGSKRRRSAATPAADGGEAGSADGPLEFLETANPHSRIRGIMSTDR